MKELHMDRFDALLSLASAECMKEEADAFLSADVSEIADNPKMLKKILGLSRKNKWKPVKIIVLVALLCMFIAFTACMLVPEIRNAVWNVFVKGHDDHVEVGFGSGEVSEEVAEVPVMNYPSTIEDKMVVTYVPEGWIKGEETGLSSQYKVSYYTTEGEWCFNIYQSAISEVNSIILVLYLI